MAQAKKGRLEKEDLRELAKQVITTGHLFAGGLFFKQIFSGQSFNLLIATLGLLLLALSYGLALTIMKGGGGNVGD